MLKTLLPLSKKLLPHRNVQVNTLKFLGLYGISFGFAKFRLAAPYCEERNATSKIYSVNHDTTLQQSKENSVGDWKLLLRLMMSDWKLYVLATVASILSSLCSSSQGLLFGKLFDALGNDWTKLIDPVRKLLSLFAASASFSFISNIALAFASNNLGDKLRRLYFEKIIGMDIEYFDTSRSSKLVHELTHDISELQSAVRSSFTNGVQSATGLVSGFVFMYYSSPSLTLLLVSILPPLTVVANSLGHFLRKISSKVNKLQSETATQADEAFSNIKTVRSFNGEKQEQQLFENQLAKVAEAKKTLAISSSIFYTSLTMGINLIALATIFFGGYLVEKNEISKGDIAAVITQTQMIERSFARLSLLVSQLSKSMQNAKNIFVVLNLKPRVNIISPSPCELPNPVTHDIAVRFKNVKFTYPSRPDIVVLEDFNLEVKKGEVIALVGASGSGKSTTFALLQRFYLPENGEIEIFGQDVSQLSSNAIHELVSIVSQEPVLFARSIEDNIKYSKPEFSHKLVLESAEKSNAHEFISEFPDSYDTILGERGALLSGGQKQRIAIARAILSDSKILLLDEATSALDNSSENKVQEALRKLMAGRTTIIIAHRLSTIKDATRICVVDKGKVVETGSHDELMNRTDSRYRALFLGQQFK